jgi:signal transduction histidine kinase
MDLPPPARWDVALALAACAALIAEGLDRGSAPAAVIVALAALTCVPLAWRSRAPLVALGATAAGLITCIAVFQPYVTAIGALMLALYSVAALGDRRRSALVAAATAALLVVLIALVSEDGDRLTSTGLRLALALGALVVGDTVRSRRALGAANRDRERRLAHEREQDAHRRVVDERLRIARELHDTVAHALVAINVRAGVAAHLGPGHEADGALTDIMDVSSQALNDLRSTLSLLREVDEPAPTTPSLDLKSRTPLVDRAQAGGLTADVDVHLDGRTLPSSVEQAGFRIVQEALTNVMRHAAASRARVALNIAHDALHIDVTDDGHGAASTNGVSAGHGLQGMSERAAALGGEVAAGPAEDGGWRVHARLPLVSGVRS